MLMYMRLIIREAQKFHGIGWLAYDSVFRQNNAAGETRWNVLDPSHHTAHIAQGGLAVVPCRLCSGVDHTPTECAEAAAGSTANQATAVSGEGAQREGPEAYPCGQLGTQHLHVLEQGQVQISWNLLLSACMTRLRERQHAKGLHGLAAWPAPMAGIQRPTASRPETRRFAVHWPALELGAVRVPPYAGDDIVSGGIIFGTVSIATIFPAHLVFGVGHPSISMSILTTVKLLFEY